MENTNRNRNAAVGAAVGGGDQRPAVLGRCTKTIGEIWEEYQNGIGGRKPARDFTTRERNRKANKSKYHRRNAIWKCMERLLD